MEVGEFTVNVALTPLNCTTVAPLRSVPVMLTLVPTGPIVGEKLVIVGGLITVKGLLLVAVPAGVVTLISPVVAPLRSVPMMLTLVPTGPLVGEKLVIVGGLITVNGLVLVAVPPGVVTLLGPVVAFAGTVA